MIAVELLSGALAVLVFFVFIVMLVGIVLALLVLVWRIKAVTDYMRDKIRDEKEVEKKQINGKPTKKEIR